MDKTQLVELRPLKPFVGSYRCKLEEADTIDEVLIEAEDGGISKSKLPKKRFIGLVPTRRRLTTEERAAYASGAPLPPRSEIVDGGEALVTLPRDPTVWVPRQLAEDLVARGLAEMLSKSNTGSSARSKP